MSDVENDKPQFSRSSSAMRSIRRKFTRAMSLSSLKHVGEDPATSPISKKKMSTTSFHSENIRDDDDFQPIINMIATYLNYHEARSPGYNETIEISSRIYDHHKPYLRTREKSLITVDKEGLTIKQKVPLPRENLCTDPTHEKTEFTEVETLYKSRRIIFCGVNQQHPKLLFFNYQHGARSENIHIHVIVCNNKADARSIAKSLKKVFNSNNKITHEMEKENKRQHQEGLNKLIAKSRESLHKFQHIPYRSAPSSPTSSVEEGT